MQMTRFRTAAVALLLAAGPSFGDDAAAATSTLKGTRPTADGTLAACYRWRAWKYGYAYAVPVSPPVVYSAPVYGLPTYSPLTEPAPATYPPAAPPVEMVPIAPTPVTGGRPTITVGYQGRFFSGSITLRPGTRSAAMITPAPRPADTFRYDGGPADPVPLPAPDPVAPTDPVPNTVPALHRVLMGRLRPAVVFPGYAARREPADPLMAKQPTRP